ncbi:homoserine O-succinyltransferase [Amylibacter sp.]|jgi:homoserine O-succinyltransferase|nr:homoserine O-succinyltransferase [Amylibacter sp.]MDB2676757.1 homoserine O-succinyltransferase [Amylibacter sp.]
MPIRIPSKLPAFEILKSEGVNVMSNADADRQDIRPLKIGLLNLMPLKIQTENQFSRLIGSTPLQIELTLIRMSEHKSKHTSSDHMKSFYKSFEDIKEQKFDGLIITGAPIEHLEFNEVTYWNELKTIFEWTQNNVHSTFGVCWGGMAMINHFHNVEKHILGKKVFGCHRCQVTDPTSRFLTGFSDDLVIPVSRWTENKTSEILKAGLKILIDSETSGPCLVEDEKHNALYIFNHFEYDKETLKQEYDRDIKNNTPINIPMNYYPNDDPKMPPLNKWRSHAHLLYGNWINQIYQTTPFDINRIGS